MKSSVLVILLILVSGSSSIWAQFIPFSRTSTTQSDSGRDWFEINTDRVRLIFPQGRSEDAREIAGLIGHYSNYVGKNFDNLAPEKFPLILRPEMALPNGFVTLAPRRSEWFNHDSYIPFVGGLSFNDALAIHEYRHIIQFDFNYQSTNKLFYFLAGDMGLSAMMAIGLPNWFFEGDAVWAETQYTHGGRGRSPRFSSRLKAMILSGMTPTYDELIGRSYNTNLPNHYVFGYYLVKRGYEKFGPDLWKKVVGDVTKFAINPYRFYHRFESHTGINFDDYVRESFSELKDKWESEGDHLKQVSSQDYTQESFPVVDGDDLYFLKRALNDYWGLYKDGEAEALVELPISPSNSKVDLRNKRLAYTQYLPSLRYGYKNYNDLFVYNLNTEETEQWSEDKRIYHPQWAPNGEKLAFVEFDSDGKWSIGIQENKESEVLKISMDEVKPFEVAWINNHEFYILGQNKLGKKSIHKMNLISNEKTKVLADTRNNLYALRVHENELYFEGDWKDRVQVMSLNEEGGLKVCSREPIAAYTPFVKEGHLYYSSEGANGQSIVKKSLSDCKEIDSDEFLGVSETTHEDPSIDLDILTKEYSVSSFSETFTGMSPHSWGLFLGTTGSELGVQGNNYLGTLSWSAAVGYNSDQSRPYGNFALSYAKYFPIFTAHTSVTERENDYLGSSGPDVDWTETQAGLRMELPFAWKSGFYNYNFKLSVDGGLIKAKNNERDRLSLLEDDTLKYQSGELSFSFAKDRTFQQIFSPFAMNLIGFYRRAESDNRNSFDSSIIHMRLNLFTPGLFENHGIKLSGVRESQTTGIRNYRHEPVELMGSEYVLSRGYNYSYVDTFSKFSFDYALPLANPDFDLWGWAFLKRIYAQAFYDRTEYELLSFNGTLDSYGLETYFETTLLRRFPISLGARYSYRDTYQDQVWDVILGLNFAY